MILIQMSDEGDTLTTCKLNLFSIIEVISLKFSLEDMFIDFQREREEWGEKQRETERDGEIFVREKYRLAASCRCLYQGSNLQPSYVP